MMVTAVEGILMVAKIIMAAGTMNETRLEWPILPILVMVEFTVLMGYGWSFVAGVIPGVALPMLTLLALVMLPF